MPEPSIEATSFQNDDETPIASLWRWAFFLFRKRFWSAEIQYCVQPRPTGNDLETISPLCCDGKLIFIQAGVSARHQRSTSVDERNHCDEKVHICIFRHIVPVYRCAGTVAKAAICQCIGTGGRL